MNEQPNIDFALATLCSALELPSGTAIALFALGRTIGWIGHALEEYQADQLIRPRALHRATAAGVKGVIYLHSNPNATLRCHRFGCSQWLPGVLS